MVHVETASGEPSGRVTDDVASNIDWWSDWHGGGGAINDDRHLVEQMMEVTICII